MQFRAGLLVPHALGKMAAAGVAPAQSALRVLAASSSAAHAREAIYGMAAAGDFDGIHAATLRAFGPTALGAASISGASANDAASGVRAAVAQLLKEPLDGAVIDRFPALASMGVRRKPMGGAAAAAAISSLPSGVNVDGILALLNVAAAAAETGNTSQATAAAAAAAKVHSLSYCNHINTRSKITNAGVDSLCNEANSMMSKSTFKGDVACGGVTLARSGNAGQFGSNNDGLNSIFSSTTFNTVVGQTCGRVKVVDVLNWCGSSGTNIIGCAPRPGSSMVVVRRSSAKDEGALWWHEYGHNYN
jgi:hypothetical protein